MIYVDKSAPAGGDGTSWQKAFNDLQDAINCATVTRPHTDLEFRMAQGTYTPDQGHKNRNTRFDMSQMGSTITLSLLGSFAGLQGPEPDRRDYVSTRTILSGDLKHDDGAELTNRADNSLFILRLSARKSATVDGVTVRGSSNVNIPSGAYSLAVYADVNTWSVVPGPASLRFTHCNFEENLGKDGGAGAVFASAEVLQISDCSFRANVSESSSGGGLTALCTDPSSFIEDCLFESNRAESGGGLRASGGMRVDRCSFFNNSASFGGALSGDVRATACLFAHNTASDRGGAIQAYDSFTMRSCTVANNSAGYGGAISAYTGPLLLISSIFWGNTSTQKAQPIYLSDHTTPPRIEYCVLTGGTSSTYTDLGLSANFGPGISKLDPRFIRPAQPADPASAWPTWNYRLKPGSPAIGAGGDLVDFDLDGNFYSSTLGPPDVGAYFITSTACAGNIARTDTVVNDNDFVAFLHAYTLMISPPADPAADLNHDGLVNDADFSLFAVAYDAMLCP